MAVDMDCNSIVDLLHTMIDAQAVAELNSEYRREFEDANRADNGRPYLYGQRTKRKKAYTPDTMPGQQTITFTDEDIEQAAQEAGESGHPAQDWLEENMDFQPHGDVW